MGAIRLVIPGGAIKPSYDLLCYLEARVDGDGTLWPSWQEETPTRHGRPFGSRRAS